MIHKPTGQVTTIVKEERNDGVNTGVYTVQFEDGTEVDSTTIELDHEVLDEHIPRKSNPTSTYQFILYILYSVS